MTTNARFSTVPRQALLVACLAAALGLPLAPARAHGPASAGDATAYKRGHAATTWADKPHHPASTRTVTSCADDNSPGTLRSQVAAAVSGDTIDLHSLVCSTISLAQGAISVPQDSLSLTGPGAASLTIDSGGQSSTFYHLGAGTLSIAKLRIANGYYVGSNYPNGGCIYSQANVVLDHSVVSHCTVGSVSATVPALGAGVYARGSLTLQYSSITNSHALAVNGANADGGGAYVLGDFKAHYSTISDNASGTLGLGTYGFAGGVEASGVVDILSSTISGNHADIVGAINLPGNAAATIVNSTVSGNSAAIRLGGIWTSAPLEVDSSTIAFNKSYYDTLATGDGLFAQTSVTVKSSIIAGNVGYGRPSDLGGALGTFVSASANLITSSTLALPANTIHACPRLGPLADNDGATHTHALGHTSPAIDHGDAGNLTIDQRFAPRGVGGADDIGSVEWQPGEKEDRIFVDGFDGLCDQ